MHRSVIRQGIDYSHCHSVLVQLIVLETLCPGTDVIAGLPQSRTIGLVCPSGTECVELEARLTGMGFDVVVLEGGWYAWQMAPVAASPASVRL